MCSFGLLGGRHGNLVFWWSCLTGAGDRSGFTSMCRFRCSRLMWFLTYMCCHVRALMVFARICMPVLVPRASWKRLAPSVMKPHCSRLHFVLWRTWRLSHRRHLRLLNLETLRMLGNLGSFCTSYSRPCRRFHYQGFFRDWSDQIVLLSRVCVPRVLKFVYSPCST